MGKEKFKYPKNITRDYYMQIATVLSNRFGHIISYDEILERLNVRGNIYATKRNISKGDNYNKDTQDINIKGFVKDVYCELFHECIHKIQQNVGISSKSSKMPTGLEQRNGKGSGFDEGAAECIRYECLKDEGILVNCNYKMSGLRINQLGNQCYSVLCSIVRQMQKTIHSDSLFESALNSNSNFQDEFIKNFGEKLFIQLRENTDLMFKIDKNMGENEKVVNDKDSLQIKTIFSSTQNILLENTFNKKFAVLRNSEDMLLFLKELQQFEQYRGKIDKDTFFSDYYNQKYSQIMQYFSNKNLDTKILEDYKYKEYKSSAICDYHTYLIAESIVDEGNDLTGWNAYVINDNDEKIVFYTANNDTKYNGCSWVNDAVNRFNIPTKDIKEFKIDKKEDKIFLTLNDVEIEVENFNEIFETVDKIKRYREKGNFVTEEKFMEISKPKPTIWERLKAMWKRRNEKLSELPNPQETNEPKYAFEKYLQAPAKPKNNNGQVVRQNKDKDEHLRD